ncbi:MAG: NAD-dependent dihydroorotate dehydrogenase B electron transfer subunit, partial [Moorella sp. (in: Bacteria)]|nr:NAD-dependent dihydroorotate dehydrogenase B electron transfer subunit [Moorella sp. (in: firmicutes)]
MKEIVAEVISNETVAPGCRRMVLDAPEAACAEPGQFVHVLCGETGYPLLRRPFSVSDAAGGRITLLYRVAGTGTRLLSQKQKGDCVNLLGPLGKGLPLEQIRSRLVLLGGGLGVAPMVLAARRAAERGIETV